MDPFNPEYYTHVLSSLTVNSRALITELTSLAETYLDQASEIVSLIEERIKKCLPQHKLFAIYLVDSICKNIGNPYNVLFGSKLYNIFTSSYLVVTDTPTRQHLINLFKTWPGAQTSSGLELFPERVIRKIEEFIIKATSISEAQAPPAPVSTLVPDMLLREGNYLLQYLIALNDELEQENLGEEHQDTVKNWNLQRNNFVLNINSVCEAIMSDSKPDFEKKAPAYQKELQNIRRGFDDQGFQQRALIKQIKESDTKEEEPVQEQIHIRPPQSDLLDSIYTDISSDEHFESILKSWGRATPIYEEKAIDKEEPSPAIEEEELSIASSLGLNFTTMNFLDSLLGSPQNQITPVTTNDDIQDGPVDSYDPEVSLSPSKPELQSSLKRPAENDMKVVKKVRFMD